LEAHDTDQIRAEYAQREVELRFAAFLQSLGLKNIHLAGKNVHSNASKILSIFERILIKKSART
jgi:hypothetical protein